MATSILSHSTMRSPEVREVERSYQGKWANMGFGRTERKSMLVEKTGVGVRGLKFDIRKLNRHTFYFCFLRSKEGCLNRRGTDFIQTSSD